MPNGIFILDKGYSFQEVAHLIARTILSIVDEDSESVYSVEKIVESCDTFPEDYRVKHQTTLMRAVADLQDVGLIKWNAEAGTFELLHITPYDPTQKA